MHLISPCYSDQKRASGPSCAILTHTKNKQNKKMRPLSNFLFPSFMHRNEEISPCSHWRYSSSLLGLSGLEISHFVFQGCCNLLQPQGQLLTLRSWILIQGGDDLKGGRKDSQCSYRRRSRKDQQKRRELNEGLKKVNVGLIKKWEER